MCSTMAGRSAGGRSVSARKAVATDSSAWSGHGVYQSMTVLLTRPGKLRQRVRSVSPTGDMASTTCMFARHFSTKYTQSASRESGRPRFCTSSRTLPMSPSFSSSAYRPGGIPLASMLFTSSRNPSSATWLSVKRNIVFLFSTPRSW